MRLHFVFTFIFLFVYSIICANGIRIKGNQFAINERTSLKLYGDKLSRESIQIIDTYSGAQKIHYFKGLLPLDIQLGNSFIYKNQLYIYEVNNLSLVDANSQLEGIVLLQYSPYAGGKGDIMWVTNKDGYEIPVVTVRYSLWNFGNANHDREGTPAYIANKLNSDADKKFSVIAVHAWSKFKDTGNSTDLIGENNNGNLNGASAAKLTQKHLPSSFETIGVQEMIWRLRMHYKPEQTKKYLENYF